MKWRTLVCGALLGAVLVGGGAVYAEDSPAQAQTASAESVQQAAVYQTEDGVLSIQAPNPQWHVVNDPKYWFVLSDGGNVITISHLSNGEALPAAEVAGNGYEAVYQTYVSTLNEVFVIKGRAVKEADLEVLMKAAATIKILKYNTKTALQKALPAPSQFTIRQINETYYSTSDHLNVRTGCSTDDQIIGHLAFGQGVQVNGAVQKDGQDYGWYQIQFSDTNAYVSAEYLSKTNPVSEEQANAAAAASEEAASEPFTVYDRNWNPVMIYKTGTFQYQDYMGNAYSQVRGTLYLREDTGDLYSVDPNYWDEDDYDEAKEAAAEAFTVYAEDGSTASIFLVGDGYQDYRGLSYSNVRGDMYYCIDTDTLFAADPDYWTEGEPTPDDTYTEDEEYYGEEADTTYEDDYSENDGSYDDSYDEGYDDSNG